MRGDYVRTELNRKINDALGFFTRLFARMVAINKLKTLTKNMIKTYHLEDKMNAV